MTELSRTISPRALPKIVMSIAICEIVGAVAMSLVGADAREWYDKLILPPWSPGAASFGPIWLLFYALMGTALGIVWGRGVQSKREKRAIVWFGAQVVLAATWNVVFFGVRAAGASYALVIVLWLCAAATLWLFSKISRAAGWLLVPCVLWITYASSLNFAILSLNFLKPAVNQMDKDPRNGPINSKPGATLR